MNHADYVYGVTATQDGATKAQVDAFRRLLLRHAIREFHHGDCVGGDAQAVAVVREAWPLAKIASHPPKNPVKRAFIQSDIVFPEADYLTRNRHIAEQSLAGLFALPKHMTEIQRSGTWSTVRRARAYCRKIFIIYPDGNVEVEL